MIHDPRKLSDEDVAAVKFMLFKAGQGQAADELGGHIAALEDELTRMRQYYEEYVIPGIEGRKVGTWSDRVVPVSVVDRARQMLNAPKER
jgi:hypothetical protein